MPSLLPVCECAVAGLHREVAVRSMFMSSSKRERAASSRGAKFLGSNFGFNGCLKIPQPPYATWPYTFQHGGLELAYSRG